MADETTQTDGTAVTAGAEPHGDAQEPEQPQVDWKAKYEQAVSESRKWEERSKANRSAAGELEKLKTGYLLRFGRRRFPFGFAFPRLLAWVESWAGGRRCDGWRRRCRQVRAVVP